MKNRGNILMMHLHLVPMFNNCIHLQNNFIVLKTEMVSKFSLEK